MGEKTIVPAACVLKLKIFRILFLKPFISVFSFFSCIWVIYVLITVSVSEISQKIVQLSFLQMMICYVFMFFIGLLHEIGHSSALMLYGEQPGRIGLAFYMTSLVLFSDVTNAWKLNRRQRFSVDYGGVYFQSFFSALIYMINAIWLKNDVLDIVASFEAFLVVGNFTPFCKYDGYWMISDLLGITDIRNTVTDFWKSIFLKKELPLAQKINMKHKVVFVLYSVCSILFIVYFINFVVCTIVKTTTIICSDIQLFMYGNIVFTVHNIIRYVANRFTSYLLLILIFAMAAKILLKLIAFLERGKDKND